MTQTIGVFGADLTELIEFCDEMYEETNYWDSDAQGCPFISLKYYDGFALGSDLYFSGNEI